MDRLKINCENITKDEWNRFTEGIKHLEKIKEVEISGDILNPKLIGFVYNFVSEFKRIFPDKKVIVHTKYDLNNLRMQKDVFSKRAQKMIDNFVDEVIVI